MDEATMHDDDLLYCPQCRRGYGLDDLRTDQPNLCANCGARFWACRRIEVEFYTVPAPTPRIEVVTLTPGQLWRRKGPLGVRLLTQYEPAHGMVPEGWYFTSGDISERTGRLIKKRQWYLPGPNPIGDHYKLADLFANPMARSIDDEWWTVDVEIRPYTPEKGA